MCPMLDTEIGLCDCTAECPKGMNADTDTIEHGYGNGAGFTRAGWAFYVYGCGVSDDREGGAGIGIGVV
ncbi:putative formin-like protein 20 [Iris pallida]|uniref:Formin-like protein 20 n=1 Tax=Iris pallida TaxID=29817 RepID=A0AAX6IA93_IRIPA|nr:putative formin-like protein 20 [Iris pallida]KAJ6850149.1 putative formin-like protein 20 [Iris pallida]